MATYRDWQMLNSSIKDVGDSLLQDRMMKERTKQNETENAFRNKSLETTDRLRRDEMASQEKRAFSEDTARGEQYKAQQAHWAEIEKAAQLGNTLKALGDSTDRIGKAVLFLGEQVRSKAMTNEQAVEYVKSAIESAPESIKAEMLKSPDMKAITEGKIDFSKVGAPKPAGQMETAQTRNIAEYAKLKKSLKEAEAAGKTDEAEIIKTQIEMIRRTPNDPAAYETVTETTEDPETGKTTSRSRKVPAAANVAPQAIPQGGKQLDLKTAQDFLMKAKGDKNKAREMAKQAGYTW